MTANPFKYTSANGLNPQQARDQWCDDGRLANAQGPENCFINGHRGTGKTMLFRIMRPDCQRLILKGGRPNFFSVYLPVRDSELSTTEFLRLEQHELRHPLSESQLCLKLIWQLMEELQAHHEWLLDPDALDGLGEAIQRAIQSAYIFAGHAPDTFSSDSFSELVESAQGVVTREIMRAFGFPQHLLDKSISWQGPLFTFEYSLLPIARYIEKHAGCPLYFLIDDADDLTDAAKEVLNSWIGRRNTAAVFKVSTMYGYKVYRTRNGSAIQHPHDFYLYEVATRFVVGDDRDYVALVHEIARKRLHAHGIDVSPEEFFPNDVKQDEAIANKRLELTEEYRKRFSGRSVTDNVYRHLHSEYSKDLHSKKSLGSFRYCGFETIALVSSGLVRHFIRSANQMYEASVKVNPNPTFIDPGIQNNILRRMADEMLTEELGNSSHKRFGNVAEEDWKYVRQLIEAVGTRFKAKLLSQDSERRVLSFAFQDEPDQDMQRWLQLALGEGYLIKGVIARKEGGGKRTLYVLTRRLAPAFELDPAAFAGYLSITSDRLREMMSKTDPLKPKVEEEVQLSLPWEEFLPDELMSIER